MKNVNSHTWKSYKIHLKSSGILKICKLESKKGALKYKAGDTFYVLPQMVRATLKYIANYGPLRFNPDARCKWQEEALKHFKKKKERCESNIKKNMRWKLDGWKEKVKIEKRSISIYLEILTWLYGAFLTQKTLNPIKKKIV